MEKIDKKYRIEFTKEELLKIDEYIGCAKKYDWKFALGVVLAELQTKQDEIINWINKQKEDKEDERIERV